MMMGIGMSGLKIIDSMKATASENSFFSRFSGVQARELNARQKFAELGQVTESLPLFFTVIGYAVVLGVGGWRVLSGDMTIGGFDRVLFIAGFFLRPIGLFVQFADLLQTLSANIQRLNDVFDSKISNEFSKQISTAKTSVATLNGRVNLSGRVELRDVTFGFQHNRRP